MSDKNYTYAVARIRAMEMTLFSASVIEQLIAVKTYEAAWPSWLRRDGGTEIPPDGGGDSGS